MTKFACRLDECHPGLFLFGDCLGFKSEYKTDKGLCEAFVVASGEFFWGGTSTGAEREALLVTPVELCDASALRVASIDCEA